MADPTTTPKLGGYTRLVRALGIGEVALGISVALLVTWLALIDLRVLVVALVLRITAWFLHLREMWTPIATGLAIAADVDASELLSRSRVETTRSRVGSGEHEAANPSESRHDSQAEPKKSDPETDERNLKLAAAELALRRLPTQFAAAYGLGWLASLVLAGVLGLLGGPAPAPIGAAEIVALTCVSLSLGMFTGVFVAALAYQVQFDERVALTRALIRRRLEPRRAPTSLARQLAAAVAVMIAAGWLLAAGCAGHLRVEALRDAAVSEQLRLAQLGAVTHDNGAALDDEALSLVTREELPQPLAELATATDPSHRPEAVALHRADEGLARAAAPTRDGRWVLASAEVDEDLGPWALTVLILAVVTTPLLGLAFFAVTRALWTPVERVGELARRLVEDGALTGLERLPPLADDEFGRLARYFAQLLDMLEGLVRSASKVADGDLRVELEHPGELHDAFRAMIDHLTNMVTRIRQTSIELASAAARIQRITQRQVEAAEQQTSSVVEVRQTVQSLATSAEEIAATATAVLDDAEQTVLTTAAMVGRINALSDQAESIGELLDLIREIAKRSDLLALNGALESTRAGEAGRGFALVATEMRRLAERVTGTVVDVGVRVSQIQAASEATVRATEDSRKLAQRTAEAARAISQVTKKQGVDTEQASREVTAVAAMVHDGANSISQTEAAAEGLRQYASELQRLTSRFKIPRGDSDY